VSTGALSRLACHASERCTWNSEAFTQASKRNPLLTIDVPAITSLGAVEVCELALSYVTTAEIEAVTIPVGSNVVPGDVAAGRVPNVQVRTELAF
jgi:Ca-activated chloride channel family protein